MTVVALISISTPGIAAEKLFKAIGEVCGFRIQQHAERFTELVKENDYSAAIKLFLDNQSIGVARILTKNDVVSVQDQTSDMACVRGVGEPFCYWMSTDDFNKLIGGP
jgi:predicted hydrocarbon binding protein